MRGPSALGYRLLGRRRALAAPFSSASSSTPSPDPLVLLACESFSAPPPPTCGSFLHLHHVRHQPAPSFPLVSSSPPSNVKKPGAITTISSPSSALNRTHSLVRNHAASAPITSSSTVISRPRTPSSTRTAASRPLTSLSTPSPTRCARTAYSTPPAPSKQ